MTERRASGREELMQIVNFSPSPHTSHTVLKGWIKDWSQSGLCLLSLQPLEQEQEIMVNHIVVPSSKRAVVRWQDKFGKDAYRIGLEFRR